MSPAPLPASPHGLAVLIVDDNPVVRLASRACAQALGLDVDCAEDGDAALRALGRRRFDAVLMDLHMPGCDGFEATRRIRALGAGRGEVPVIALSATAEARDLRRCRDTAMNACLEKPLDAHRLAAVLDRLCRPDGAGRDGAWTWFETGASATHRPSPVARDRSALQRLERALAEQSSRHGPAHPLTRALMRAAGRLSGDLEPALNPSGR